MRQEVSQTSDSSADHSPGMSQLPSTPSADDEFVSLPRRQIIVTLGGVMLALLLASLDPPIVSRGVVGPGGDSVREQYAWLRRQQDWRRAVDRLAEENIDVVSVGHRVNPR